MGFLVHPNSDTNIISQTYKKRKVLSKGTRLPHKVNPLCDRPCDISSILPQGSVDPFCYLCLLRRSLSLPHFCLHLSIPGKKGQPHHYFFLNLWHNIFTEGKKYPPKLNMKGGQTIREHYWLRPTEALKLELKSSKAHRAVWQLLWNTEYNWKSGLKLFFLILLKIKHQKGL